MQTEQDTVCLFSDLARELKLEDRYHIVGRIGGGGMGDVFKAYDDNTERFVAIKVLSANIEKSPEATARFTREAKVLAGLRHPNIVSLFSFGAGTSICPYQIMDYLEGVSLAARLNDGPLSICEFRQVFFHLIDALRYASAEGLVHRDIKPANIFLCSEDGNLKPVLLDFGIVRRVEAVGETLTATQTIIGSPPYMSPEQCRGETVDHLSDIYSLGCVMYEALTGKPPFEGETAADVMLKHMNEPVPTLEAHNGKEIGAPLCTLIQQCLSKSPQDRPQKFEEISAALCEALDAVPADASFVRTRKKTLPLELLTTLLVLLLVPCVWFAVLMRTTEPQNVVLPAKESHFSKTAESDLNVPRQIGQINRWKRRLAQISNESERSRLAECLVDAQKQLAHYYRNNDQFQLSLETYSDALNYSGYLDDLYKQEGDIYDNLAELCLIISDAAPNEQKKQALIKEALTYSDKAIKVVSKSGIAKAHVRARRSRGLIFLELRNIPEAVNNLQQLITRTLEIPKEDVLAESMTDLDKSINLCVNDFDDPLKPAEAAQLFDLYLRMADVLEIAGRLYEGGNLVKHAKEWFSLAYPQSGDHSSDAVFRQRSESLDRLEKNFSQAMKERQAKPH